MAWLVIPHNWSVDSIIILEIHNTHVRIDTSGFENVIEYFEKLDTLNDEFREKYKPLPRHYEESADGYVNCSLEGYLRLHNVYLDIVKEYGDSE